MATLKELNIGRDRERAQERAKQLTAVDRRWTCPAAAGLATALPRLAGLADTETGDLLPAIEPGVLFGGDELGKWLKQQKQPGTWGPLTDGPPFACGST
ncbi:hypothetical protein [Streptomyces sp. NPDC054838]